MSLYNQLLRSAIRQINPMGQYDILYSKSNFISYTGRGFSLLCEIRADLIDSIPYRNCFIPSSAKTEIAKFYGFFIFGISAVK